MQSFIKGLSKQLYYHLDFSEQVINDYLNLLLEKEELEGEFLGRLKWFIEALEGNESTLKAMEFYYDNAYHSGENSKYLEFLFAFYEGTNIYNLTDKADFRLLAENICEGSSYGDDYSDWSYFKKLIDSDLPLDMKFHYARKQQYWTDEKYTSCSHGEIIVVIEDFSYDFVSIGAVEHFSQDSLVDRLLPQVESEILEGLTKYALTVKLQDNLAPKLTKTKKAKI